MTVILERLVALRDLLADTVRIWVKVVFLPDSTNIWFFPQIVHLASFGAQLFLATLAFRNRLWRVQAQLAHAGASFGSADPIHHQRKVRPRSVPLVVKITRQQWLASLKFGHLLKFPLQ